MNRGCRRWLVETESQHRPWPPVEQNSGPPPGFHVLQAMIQRSYYAGSAGGSRQVAARAKRPGSRRAECCNNASAAEPAAAAAPNRRQMQRCCRPPASPAPAAPRGRHSGGLSWPCSAAAATTEAPKRPVRLRTRCGGPFRRQTAACLWGALGGIRSLRVRSHRT